MRRKKIPLPFIGLIQRIKGKNVVELPGYLFMLYDIHNGDYAKFDFIGPVDKEEIDKIIEGKK